MVPVGLGANVCCHGIQSREDDIDAAAEQDEDGAQREKPCVLSEGGLERPHAHWADDKLQAEGTRRIRAQRTCGQF